MYERHTNRERYFREQVFTTEKHVIPYIREVMPITPDMVVAEIGCGEGGNLKPFLDLGCKVIGIDLSESKIANGEAFFAEHPLKENLTLVAQDIYEVSPDTFHRFDLVIMRDTIEHIHNQDKFMDYLKQFLNPGGKVFLAFPPWRMPFGGHQQICRSKFLTKLPYFHILPVFMYRGILKLFGENEATIESLLEIKETGISIARFRRIVSGNNYQFDRETLYFINPNYEVKFKLKTRKLWPVFNLPFLRDFFTTAHYSVISVKGND
ncbi:MAG TPA: class I SAM-dependent methyltransferase [Fluviicola sp.]|nr:class I SAM-dependent methyltransferase [Fluviicola sp.]